VTVPPPQILQLFQECTETQMLRFPGCSEKRASILLSLRPFESFSDLVQKITDTKGLTTQILHNVQEMLDELAVCLVVCMGQASLRRAVVGSCMRGMGISNVRKAGRHLNRGMYNVYV
jgi:hypothetical protein